MRQWINNFLNKAFGLHKSKPTQASFEFGPRDEDGFRQVFRDGKPVVKMYTFTPEMFKELRDAIKTRQREQHLKDTLRNKGTS